MFIERHSIREQHETHFLTLTVVDWLDVFTRLVYKEIITNSLEHCVAEKGLELFAWVLMTNHLHLVARANKPHGLSAFLRDFKKHTSKAIAGTIQHTPESRREWLLPKMKYHALSTGRAERYKFWTDDNHPVLLNDPVGLVHRINYTHYNPVRQGIVEHPHEYLFSSARDYAGMRGIVPVTVLELRGLK